MKTTAPIDRLREIANSDHEHADVAREAMATIDGLHHMLEASVQLLRIAWQIKPNLASNETSCLELFPDFAPPR